MSNKPSVELSLEQKFNIRAFEAYVKELPEEEAKKRLVDLFEEMLVKDIIYKELIKKEWGI